MFLPHDPRIDADKKSFEGNGRKSMHQQRRLLISMVKKGSARRPVILGEVEQLASIAVRFQSSAQSLLSQQVLS